MTRSISTSLALALLVLGCGDETRTDHMVPWASESPGMTAREAATPNPDPEHINVSGDGRHITVLPTGDERGVEDQENLTWALGACPRKGVVQLVEGVYYASRRIEVTPDKIDPDLPFGPENIRPHTGFDGTLRGMGKGEEGGEQGTIIRAVRKDQDTGFPQGDIYETFWVEGQGGGLPILLYFYRPEHVAVRDLALEVLDLAPAALYRNPWDQYGDTPANPQSTALLQLLLTRNGSFTAIVEDVRFTGAPSEEAGNYFGHNLGYTHVCAGGDPITLFVKDCEMSHGRTGPEFFVVGPDSVAVFEDNTLSDFQQAGIWVAYNAPTTTTIVQDNVFSDCIPIVPEGEPGEILACDNVADGVPMPDDCADE